MPDSCDSSTTSEDSAATPDILPYDPHSHDGTAHASRWGPHTPKRYLDLHDITNDTVAHAQKIMMSETCAQNQFGVRQHGLDNRQGALLERPVSKNEGWVSFNKEMLQNILENTIKLQMTQTDSADEDHTQNADTSRDSIHDTDGSDCVVNVDGSTSVDSDSDNESINVTRCDDDSSTQGEDLTDNHRPLTDDAHPGDVYHDSYRDSFQERSALDPRSDALPVPAFQCVRAMPGTRQYGADVPCDLGSAGFKQPEQARQPLAGYVRACGSHPVRDAPVNSGDLDIYQCWQRSAIPGYRFGGHQVVSGDSRGDRQQARATQPLILGSTGELLLHNTATLAALHQSALRAHSANNMTVEQHRKNNDTVSENLEHHGNTNYDNTHRDRRTCVPCKNNITFQNKITNNMMNCGDTCINTGTCFSDEQLDNNSTKTKGRQCKVKVTGRQHWVRISKAAIEDILDELVVSSISDDSGTESRSHTPTSGVSEISHQSASRSVDVVHATKDEHGQRSVHHHNPHVTKRNSSPSPTRSNATHREGSHSPTPVQCHSTPSNSITRRVISSCNNHAVDSTSQKSQHHVVSSNSNDSDLVVDKYDDSSDAVSKAVGMGWAVLNKPMISDVVDRAFATLNSGDIDGTTEVDTVHKEVQESRETSSEARSRNCSGESGHEFKHPENPPSSGPPATNGQGTAPDAGLMSGGPWNNPATALLLGALCIGEHKKVCQLAEARAKKRSSVTSTAGPSAKTSRNDVDCVGVDLRTSIRNDNPVTTEDDHRSQLRSMYMSQHRKPNMTSHPQSRKVSQAMRKARTNRARSRGSRVSVEMVDDEADHEVIDVEKHDMSNYPPQPAHNLTPGQHNNRMLPGYRPVSIIPGQTNMCAAINLATNNPHSMPINVHNDRNSSQYATDQNAVVIDGGGGHEYNSEPTDLSAHTEKMSMSKSPKAEKLIPNKPARKNVKNSPKLKKEPRYGWIVVSKDEVHTIMDSLTSQLFVDDLIEGSENDTKTDSSQDTRSNNKQGSNLAQADVLRNKGNDMNQPQHAQTGHPKDTSDISKGDGHLILDTSVIDSNEAVGCPRSTQSGELQSHDEEFRRTTIDALNAVYNHEDGIETGVKSFNTDQPQSQSQDTTATPSANQTYSSNTTQVSGQQSDSPVKDIVHQTGTPSSNYIVNDYVADDTNSSDSSSSSSSSSTNTSHVNKSDVPLIQETPQEQTHKGFKWKSSILARVLDDQDTDTYSRPAPADLTQTKQAKKRLSSSVTNRRVKRTNKRR